MTRQHDLFSADPAERLRAWLERSKGSHLDLWLAGRVLIRLDIPIHGSTVVPATSPGPT